MAAGICRLIENPEEAERLGENARKIAEIANGQAVFEQWRDYIETLIG
jgi:glycosyltransferase involved in cell wall biosynthesis